MSHYLGGHTRDVGGIHLTVRRAARANMRAMQLFTAMPQFYGDKSNINPDRVARFKSALAETQIDPKYIIVHSAYVINNASPEPEKASRARSALAKELERTTLLGVRGACFHPGSAGTSDLDAAIDRVAAAMTHALESVPGDTCLYIENTAGAGRTVGRTAKEVGDILAKIPNSVRARAGYGLDTCHLFSSGHAIHESRDALRGVLDQFEDVTGERPSFFHLNDSAGELGSNRDRHMLIGEGRIGVEPFRWLFEDARSHDIPLVFELAQYHIETAENDDTPDPTDVRMMELLTSLTRA
ncbi:MAG TPA: deoxyribonuclease IV [Gemmatimonadaceae bacterium]|nr:deoxyribonuclease IV [Gemmatimonadaceae bacterium]